MSGLIKNHEDWEKGMGFGLQRGCLKEVEKHFGFVKMAYLDTLKEIYDIDLIEEVHDHVYLSQCSRFELERIMNLIKHAHDEQIRRNKAVSEEVNRNNREKDDSAD